MNPNLQAPLGGPPPAEVPLSRAPLERVIAQVQFTRTFAIGESSAISGFQKALRDKFPWVDSGTEYAFRADQGQFGHPIPMEPRPVYIFHDEPKEWRVSLTSESIGLDVQKYSSRSDFLEKWAFVLKAVEDQFGPPVVQRIGMRYVDRIQSPEYDRLEDLIKPEYLGPLLPKFRNQVKHMISETALQAEEGVLLIRLAKLPGGSTIDPNVLEPIKDESFLMDIDISSTTPRKFIEKQLSKDFTALSERAYATFRDVVNDSFLEAYGGSI